MSNPTTSTTNHPTSCTDPDNCSIPTYRDHLLGIGIHSSALPTRAAHANTLNTRGKSWAADHDAFDRLTRAGYEPPQLDGSAFREAHAETPADLTHREVNADPDTGATSWRTSRRAAELFAAAPPPTSVQAVDG